MQNDYDPALGQAAEALAKKWHTSDLMAIGSQGPKDASPNDIKDWSSEMLVAFLDKLASYRAKQPMHKLTTRQMAKLYSLDDSKNAEIRGSWYKLAINAGMMMLLTLLVWGVDLGAGGGGGGGGRAGARRETPFLACSRFSGTPDIDTVFYILCLHPSIWFCLSLHSLQMHMSFAISSISQL